jgi:ankyrin repeat protein
MKLVEYIFDRKEACEVDPIKSIIASYPDSLLFLDAQVNLPIHLAVRENVAYEVVEVLALASPVSLTVCNIDGLTVFDMVVCYCCCPLAGNQRVVELFLRVNPQCTRFQDDRGTNSYHRIFGCSMQPNFPETEQILQYLCEHTDAIGELCAADTGGRTPLITLLKSDRPASDIVKFATWMITRYPKLASLQSSFDEFPAHVVLERILAQDKYGNDEMNNTWTPLFNQLVQMVPDCLRVPYSSGTLPFIKCLLFGKYSLGRHLCEMSGNVACRSLADCGTLINDPRCPVDLLSLILESYLNSIDDNSTSTQYVLMRAIECDQDVSIIMKLMGRSPTLLMLPVAGSVDFVLHAAVKRKCKETTLRMLIDAYPDPLGVLSSDGVAPLSALIMAKCYNAEFIIWCVDRCPSSATITDSTSDLPIHNALRFGAESRVIQRLIDSFPDSLRIADNEKAIPMHRVLESSAATSVSDDIIVRMVQLYPDGCKRKNRLGDFPLHDAVRNSKSLKVIEAITDVYPDAIITADKEGVNPVQLLVAQTGRSRKDRALIMMLFVRMNSKSASMPLQADGQCLLHIVVQDRGFDEFQLAESIVGARAECASCRCRGGNLPLHAAVRTGAAMPCKAALIAAFPDGLKAKDPNGDLPLHLALRDDGAVRSSRSLEDIVQLIDGYPEAVSIQDKERELPIHYALRSRSNAAIVNRLLDCYPDCLRVADKEKDLPLHRALEATAVSGSYDDVIIRMVRMYPDGCKKKNRLGDMPLHDAVRTGKAIAVIEALADVHPDAVVTVDKEGADPIHMMIQQRVAGMNYTKEQQAAILLLFVRMNVKAASLRSKDDGLTVMHTIVRDRGFDSFQLIENIVSIRPECASIRCANTGDLPIHFAVQTKATLASKAALIAAFPDGLKIKDKDGDLPLHMLLKNCNDNSLGDIEQLLIGYPDAVKVQDKERELPIHYALRFKARTDVIHRLLDAYPECLQIADREQDLPLHRALETAATVDEVIIRMIRMFPDSCKKKNRRGDYPLHDAVTSFKSIAVIEALTDVYPEAATLKDKEGADPIHMISATSMLGRNKYSKEQQAAIVLLFVRMNSKAASLIGEKTGLCVIHLVVSDRGYDAFQLAENILTRHPECASIRCKRDGDLPIHMAVRTNAPTSLRAALIAAFPDGLKAKDRTGDLPLHYAVRNGAVVSVDSISQLIDGYPEAVSKTDKEGELPIHYALRFRCSPAVIHRLLDAYPECVRVADREKDLPLHRGLEERSTTDEVIIRMIGMYPDGCKKKNRQGDLPLHDAVRSGQSLAVIAALTDVYPEAIITKDKEGADPIHLITERFGATYSKEKQASIIQLFVRMNVKAASLQNRGGLCVMHVIVQDRAFDQYRLVESILSQRPECASIRCGSGDLPIHFAVQSRAPFALKAVLIAAFPDGLKTKDREGDLPLHYAVRGNNVCTLQDVVQLVDGYPAGVSMADKEGLIPAFSFARKKVYHELLTRLIRENTVSAAIVDRNNCGLIKAALEQGATALPSIELVTLLVENYSRLSGVDSADGSCAFPLMCQCWDTFGPLCVDLLERLPLLSGACGRDGQTGLHKLMMPASPYDNAHRMKLLTKWIEVNDGILGRKDAFHETPISYLLKNSREKPNVEILRMMIHAHPTAIRQVVRPSNITLVELALTNCHPAVFGELIGNGASLLDGSPTLFEQAQRIAAPGRIVNSYRCEYIIYKRGGVLGIWRKRCFRFCLFASAVFYFRRTESVPRGTIGLQLAVINKRPDINGAAFELRCKSNNRLYVLQATSDDELDEVIEAFQTCIAAVSV